MRDAQTKYIVIIGDPVSHSLSPTMHNTAYQATGLEKEYVYLASDTNVEEVGNVIHAMRALRNFHGLTCTVPHKVKVMPYLDEIDTTARNIGAVNTVVKEKGILKGYNTDWLGIVSPLRKKVPQPKDKKVLVIGAGGAARAAIYGALHESCKVTILNRNVEKACLLAHEFGCDILDTPTTSSVFPFDIIINTTPLGMPPYEKESPLPDGMLHSEQVVFDVVYHPKNTVLLQQALSARSTCIYGWEMLLHQATAQFTLYTGRDAPEAVMQNVIHTSYET